MIDQCQALSVVPLTFQCRALLVVPLILERQSSPVSLVDLVGPVVPLTNGCLRSVVSLSFALLSAYIVSSPPYQNPSMVSRCPVLHAAPLASDNLFFHCICVIDPLHMSVVLPGGSLCVRTHLAISSGWKMFQRHCLDRSPPPSVTASRRKDICSTNGKIKVI